MNKNAATKYAPEKNFLVVEGGIDLEETVNLIHHHVPVNYNLVYSGALTEYSGVKQLIAAMEYVDKENVFLEIYGSGELEEYVSECSKKMRNVFFKGKVDNDAIKKIQANAFLLVNPRPPSDPISNVTFPSKIFEYMMSGTPVLTTRLSGFTSDYLERMYVVESNDPDRMANKINEIFDLPSEVLNLKAEQAKKYIIENKTWDSQVPKIVEFMRKW